MNIKILVIKLEVYTSFGYWLEIHSSDSLAQNIAKKEKNIDH